jgi:nucleotide-binding universal stress UspA family protein
MTARGEDGATHAVPGDAVVVGVDGSDSAAQVLRVGAELAASLGVRLVVVHVERLPPAAFAGPTTAAGSLLMANLEATDALHVECELMLAAHGGPWSFEVRQGDPASELGHAADRYGAGMIVVGNSRHRLPRVVGTSVTDRLIRRTAASVLFVPSAPWIK